jgi:hypothetical protein
VIGVMIESVGTVFNRAIHDHVRLKTAPTFHHIVDHNRVQEIVAKQKAGRLSPGLFHFLFATDRSTCRYFGIACNAL